MQYMQYMQTFIKQNQSWPVPENRVFMFTENLCDSE